MYEYGNAMTMGRVKIWVITAVFVGMATFLGAQTPLRMQKFSKALDSLRSLRAARLSAYRLSPSARQRTPADFLLVDVTPQGLPIYRAPLNMNAATTTGVTPLHAGTLGLTLQGKGMVVGVWDAGKVADHIELGDRVIYREASTVHSHATHVTGTLIASGINPSAKGMAPLAQARTWYYDHDYDDIFNQLGPNGVKLSNHSYGSVAGWARVSGIWKWFGDTTISKKEDYRFGYYGLDAWAIDELSNLDPYYSIVWAAGNDRWEAGDGTYPKDGNEGTGYDCLIPEANAKNSIVVGAVSRVLNYTGPASVAVAFFSSWGPTDDGRIKPDLVGDGVDLVSLNSSPANAYYTTRGTSQAAANVTGSLILVQELYKRLHGNRPVRAATLRALVIHTAKEAGADPGPDYQNGWGLLDVEQASKTLLAHDDVNVLVQELSLKNHETLTIPLQPQAGKKITVTVAWTDPSGTSPLPALDPQTLMLVNDLDVKLVDQDGNETLPWILDPASPATAASRGNNFRDNVEKIEFDAPLDKTYSIVVSHKGELTQDQPFSVIVSHTSKINTGTAYYWIGNSGHWSDVNHWSLTTGGPAAASVPAATDNVIIDDNSFSGPDEAVITLDSDVACRSLAWLTSEPAALSMDAKTLATTAALTLASDTFRIATAGTFKLHGAGEVNLHTDLTEADLLFSSGTWGLYGLVNARRVDIDAGTVDASAAGWQTPTLALNGSAILDLHGNTISSLTSFLRSAGATLRSGETTLVINGAASFTWNGGSFDGMCRVEAGGQLTLSGNNTIDSLHVAGTAVLTGSNSFNHLEAAAGAQLMLASQQTQRPALLVLNGAENMPVTLTATAAENAALEFAAHEKICFDYLDVSRVDVTGAAVVSAGGNSSVSGAAGWLEMDCDEVLFSNFAAEFTCEHGLTLFADMSTGPIDSWSWDFGDPESTLNSFNGSNARHRFSHAGLFTVSLTVASPAGLTQTYQKEIEIKPNTVPVNSIVFNGGTLASSQTADFYQWYLNDEPLSSATEKTFIPEIEGNYTVVTTTAECNYVSDPFFITATGHESQGAYRLSPNPADGNLVITTPLSRYTVSIYTAMGTHVGTAFSNNSTLHIDTSALPEGLYIADLQGHKLKFLVIHR